MKRHISSSHEFTGPWWVAASLLRIEGPGLVVPVLEELHAQLTRGTTVERAATVECGALVRGESSVAMPVHWSDATHPGAFPEMQGEIRLVEHGDNVTDLEFTGEYEPPLGVLGAAGDTLAGHRVAEHTVDEAMVRLARAFEAAVSEHIGTPGHVTRSDA